MALVQANETNEKRRQFTEAVVEGVSAGIVGLDAFGAITLFNARASEMLGKDELSVVGQQLGEVVPALAPIVERAKSSRRGQIRDQIEIGSGPDYRTYQVQLTREGTMAECKGYVITLDDITDLAVGAAHRRLGRRGAPHRARDQEPADADPAQRRAPAPPLWPASSPTISRCSTNRSTPSCGRSATSAGWSTSSRPSHACPRRSR